MSENLTALASENLNPSLRSLLEDVQRGHIRVPRFQRPFVWSDNQRLELLESIRDNVPIGSLLVWRASQFKLASFDKIGPHVIPATVDQISNNIVAAQYLLDGHQRVSTLLGLLFQASGQAGEGALISEDGVDWNIQYDLMDQVFDFPRKRARKPGKRPLLPLWALFDGRMVNRHMRQLRNTAAQENWSESELNSWEERADQLSYRFQQCRIPIVVMVTEDLDLAITAFKRVNSLGTPMGEAHLVAAMTWSEDFDLRERIDSLREKFQVGWHEIDESLFLQVCKGLSGLEVNANEAELIKSLTKDKSLLERAGNGLRAAVELLTKEAGVVNQQFLPYSLQLVFLAVELAKKNLDATANQMHLKWFWRTSWAEVFGSASYRQVRAEQEALHQPDSASPETWEREKLPPSFDFRFARIRLFTIRLGLRNDLLNSEGEIISGQNLLANFGRDALVRLFPTPRDANENLKKLLRGQGNRFFISPEKAALWRDRLKNGPALPSHVLQAHFIDDQTLSALHNNNLERFIELRHHSMDKWDEAEFEKSKLL